MEKFKDKYPQFYRELVKSELPQGVVPEELLCSDKRKFLWECKNGHQWTQVLANRTKKGGSFCQYCLGKLPYPGESDLATLYPDVSKEWDYEKNEDTPIGFATHSRKKKWWICPQGHSYDMRVINRTTGQQNCPYCSGKRVLPGFNDVATTRPEILKYWDYEKNEITPQEITEKSAKKIWFTCGKPGHSWQGTLVKLGRGKSIECRVCSGHNVIPGVNDLASQFPEIAAELVGEDPENIYMFSTKKLTWKCPQNHIREVKCFYRTKDNAGICYECETGRKKPKESFDIEKDSLIVRYPEIAERFDKDKNPGVDINVVFYGSTKRLWWKCKRGHSFRRQVNAYTYQHGECPYCSNKKLLQGFNDFPTIYPNLLHMWDYSKNKIGPENYLAKSSKKVNWVCINDKDHSFQKSIYAMVRTNGSCPICFSEGRSGLEQDLADFVMSILPDNTTVLRNDRSLIHPKELDIYIPSKNIAIEFNGLYWHSETSGKDRYYHYDKWKQCSDKDVQLITIWEDDWVEKRSIIEKMLVHKLGVDNSRTIYARKTSIEEIGFHISKEFLDENHIQESSQGSVYFGLYYGDDLVAVSVWRKNKKKLYLDRYATSCNVVGGMGKMLKQGILYAKEHGLSQIITFADHEVSNGNLYDVLGFDLDGLLDPDYKYVINGQRKHKFGYRLKRFKNDPELIYRDGLTELQLAELNDLHRVWDCGKSRYVISI